jgi:hypothetical protein
VMARLIGQRLWDGFHRWPAYGKFCDNLGPIPHHLHQNAGQGGRSGPDKSNSPGKR